MVSLLLLSFTGVIVVEVNSRQARGSEISKCFSGLSDRFLVAGRESKYSGLIMLSC